MTQSAVPGSSPASSHTPPAGGFITIKVVTTGDDLEDRFNVHQPLQVVFNRALQLVGGAPTRDRFTLEYEDAPLNLDASIGEYVEQLGWSDGVELELVARPEVI